MAARNPHQRKMTNIYTKNNRCRLISETECGGTKYYLVHTTVPGVIADMYFVMVDISGFGPKIQKNFAAVYRKLRDMPVRFCGIDCRCILKTTVFPSWNGKVGHGCFLKIRIAACGHAGNPAARDWMKFSLATGMTKKELEGSFAEMVAPEIHGKLNRIRDFLNNLK